MSNEPDKIDDIATIFSCVRRIISEEMGVESENVQPGTNIITELGAGQSDMESIMTATEHKFQIKISNENWGKVRMVCDIVHLVDVYLEIKQIEM